MKHFREVCVGLMAAGMLAWMGGTADAAAGAADVSRAVPGQAWSLDLGGGVKMEFVWIEVLKGWVGKYEVTQGDYRRCKPEHATKVPYHMAYHGVAINDDRHPVSYVSHEDAVAFCQWVHDTHAAQVPAGYKVRLPDEDEWTIFAHCGEQRKYPWGDEWPPKYGNWRDESGAKAFPHWKTHTEGYDDGFAGPAPVERSGKNDCGVYGAAGNVWELTAAIDDKNCVMRGGSWHRSGENRRQYPRVMRDSGVGFRVVALAAAPPKPAATQAAPEKAP